MKVGLLSFVALLAFAGNSVLCRLALLHGVIDPAGFTVFRLLSGAIALLVLMLLASEPKTSESPGSGSWLAAASLFVYAAGFSFAYQSLDTASGALILFGVVQLTMVASSAIQGQRPASVQWLGLALSVMGLVYLLLPETDRPPLSGALLMALAGLAWAVYTLLGRGSVNPIRTTAANFVRTLPFAFVLSLLAWESLQLTPMGIVLAVASGALASGFGYAIWYAALRDLTTLSAAVVQLSVPIIAAIGGVLFNSEVLSLRLMIASALVLFGILLVIIPTNETKIK